MKGYQVTFDYKSYCKRSKRLTSYKNFSFGHVIKDVGSEAASLAQMLQACRKWEQYPSGKRFIKQYASGPALVSINRLMISVMYNFRLKKDGASDEIY